jgi:hypothetical protein
VQVVSAILPSADSITIMGRTKHAQERILEELGRSQKGKKELKKVVKAKDPTLKKYVKKALKKLVDKGEIKKDGQVFRIVSTEIVGKSSDSDGNPVLPIAVRLRKEQEAETAAKRSVKFAEDNVDVDLDDEIRRLEMELNQSSNESSSDEESTVGPEEPGVLSLSAYAEDRIEQLPDTYLPESGKYNAQDKSKSSKKKRDSKQNQHEQKKTDGLREAVKEVLMGYKARSSEKIPFYCRFCSKQYNNEDEFFDHRKTEFHKTAVDMERKATYCRLCMKQLTSPEQMKEHLKSRPHKDRLNTVRTRQRMEGKGGKQKQGQSVRQWT